MKLNSSDACFHQLRPHVDDSESAQTVGINGAVVPRGVGTCESCPKYVDSEIERSILRAEFEILNTGAAMITDFERSNRLYRCGSAVVPVRRADAYSRSRLSAT